MARTNKPGTQAPTDGIKVTERSLDSYAFDPANANKGKPRGQKMIEDSIRELGTGRSVLADADDVLIAGNHALEAARSVGITRAVEVEVPDDVLVVVKRPDVRLADGGKARRLANADNRIASVNLDFDPAALLADMDSLKGLWREDEIDALQTAKEDLDAVQAAMNAEEPEGDRLTSERQKQIKPVLYAADISTFEEAIKATGLINRGEALIEVCRFYLESKK